MTIEKAKPKQLLRPITTGANSAMNQLQFLAITCNSLKEQEKSRVHGAIGFGFGFVSHWLKNWRESFKPITKRSNRNHVITFDSHLKTALYVDINTATSLSMPKCDSCFYFKAQAIYGIAWGLQTNVLSSFKKSMRNSGKIICKFQTAVRQPVRKPSSESSQLDSGYLVLWKPHPAVAYVFRRSLWQNRIT